MKRIIKLTESDLTRIVKRMVNETKEKTDTKFNKKWVGMINTRLKNGNLNSALEMAENLNDEIGGMSNVVKHLKNAKSEIDKAKDKLNSLSESDTSRTHRRVMLEEVDQLSDLKKLMRKNDDQSLEDEIEERVNHAFKNMDPKAFKTLEKYSTELSALVAYRLLPKFMFKDNVTKKYETRDFLINYIKKKYSSKFKKHYNN